MSASTNHKRRVRLQAISLNALLTVTAPLINVLAAWWVIRSHSEALWGAFVDPLIITGIALHILAWGNKEFLLRAFALRPDAIPLLWKQAFLSRGMLLFIALPALFLSDYGWNERGYLLTWILAGFFKQSLDVAVVYAREFGRALLVEVLTGGALFAALYLSGPELDLASLIKYFAFAQVVRAVAYAIFFGKTYLSGPYPQIQFRYFQVAMPFFLLGFAGMLGSRVDLICVSLWMDDAAAGRYQVVVNLLLWTQAGAGFLLYPFVKNIYRLPLESFRKLSRRVLLIGIPISLAAAPAVWGLSYYLFNIDLGWPFHLLSVLFILPIYAYTTHVFFLYKYKRQQQVLLANFGAVLVNAGLNVLLVPRLGLDGALLATAASQVFLMGMIHAYAWQVRRDLS